MDKQFLIDIDTQIRNRKDVVKDQIKKGAVERGSSQNQVIIAPMMMKPTIEMKADQWYHQGFFIKAGEHIMVVDPGVGLFSRFNSTGLAANNITSVFVSHNHTDHVIDTAPFVEKLLRNKSKEKWFYMHEDQATEVLSSYYHNKLQEDSNTTYTIMNKELEVCLPFGKLKTIALAHTIPCFGFKLYLEDKVLGYVSDTGLSKNPDYQNFGPKIKDFYADVDTAVVNINDLEFNRHSPTHLAGWDVIELFKDSKLSKLIAHHLPLVNIDGEDSRYLYKLFFEDQPYDVVIPHVWGSEITI